MASGPSRGFFSNESSSFYVYSTFICDCCVQNNSCWCNKAGCLIRGLATDISMVYIGYAVLGLGAANLWTTVLSYLASITDPSQRQIVVSGYLFQVLSCKFSTILKEII